MGKIQLLDTTVSARIAAGEVVERPSSIVKELVENSIDAHASAITIAVQDGGVREIRVTDNGDGISPEDMPLAIVKHATSKIYTMDDLEHIYSMGFRGEALSSIAAVSMLTIKSRPKSSEKGTECYVRGGKVEFIKDAGVPEGTFVLVENLFFNTPARLKFLRKQNVETAAITDIVQRLILARPEVSFRYRAGDKAIFHSPGNASLEDAIYSVYGFTWKGHLLRVNFTHNNIKVTGYIGSPNQTVKTTKYGSLYINQRYVKNSVLHNAILQAYGERLLKGAYPFYVLHFDMPAEDVDVNVHPNKLEVHFRDNNEMEYITLTAISEALQTEKYAPVIPLPSNAPLYVDDAQEEVGNTKIDDIKAAAMLNDSEIAEAIDTVFEIAANPNTKASFFRQPPDFEVWKDDLEVLLEKQEKTEKPVQPNVFSEVTACQVLGVAFSSFIIVEANDSIYFIDQHAAHERKLYDQLMAHTKNRVIQQKLLVPAQVPTTAAEQLLIESNMEVIEELGFSLGNFTNTNITITAIPQVLGNIDILATFQDIIASLENEQGDIALRKDKIAKGACKKAIKAGDKMSLPDIEELITTIVSSGAIPHCPHGRPIAIGITKAQLETSFRRRV